MDEGVKDGRREEEKKVMNITDGGNSAKRD